MNNDSPVDYFTFLASVSNSQIELWNVMYDSLKTSMYQSTSNTERKIGIEPREGMFPSIDYQGQIRQRIHLIEGMNEDFETLNTAYNVSRIIIRQINNLQRLTKKEMKKYEDSSAEKVYLSDNLYNINKARLLFDSINDAGDALRNIYFNNMHFTETRNLKITASKSSTIVMEKEDEDNISDNVESLKADILTNKNYVNLLRLKLQEKKTGIKISNN